MIDIAAVAYLPLDITIELTEGDKKTTIERAFKAWAGRGADLKGLPGVFQSLSIPPDRYRISPGGNAASAVRVAQQWGCSTALGGTIGKDTAGEYIHGVDTESGIDLSLVQSQDDRRTPILLFLVRQQTADDKVLFPRTNTVTSQFQSDNTWAPYPGWLQNMNPSVLHLNKVNQKLLKLIAALPKDTRYSLNLLNSPQRAAEAYLIEQLLQNIYFLTFSHQLPKSKLKY